MSRRGIGLLLAPLTVLIGACGGGGDADPVPGLGDTASVVPQQITAYAEISLEPDELQENRLNVLDAHFHVSALSQIETALLRWASGTLGLSGMPHFAQDVDPWMAPRVGVFALETLDRREVAVVLPIDDLEAFDRFRADAIPDEIAESLAVEAEIRELRAGAGIARLGDFIVLGDIDAVAAGVDAHRGASLLETNHLQRLVARPAAAHALAFGIVDWSRAVSTPAIPVPGGTLVSGHAPPSAVLLTGNGVQTATAADPPETTPSSFLLSARGEGITLDLESELGGGVDLAGAEELFATLPGSAWIAYVHPSFRRTFGGAFRQGLVRGILRRSPQGSSPETALRDFERLFGVDVDATTRGIETGGFFLGDVSEFSAGGVIEFSSRGEARDASILARLAFTGGDARIIEGPPSLGDAFLARFDGGEVIVAANRDRLVFASDPEALRAAVNRRPDPGGAKAFPEPLTHELGGGYTPIGYADMVQLATGIGVVDIVITPSFDRTIASVVDVFERLAIGLKTDDQRLEVRLVAAPWG